MACGGGFVLGCLEGMPRVHKWCLRGLRACARWWCNG